MRSIRMLPGGAIVAALLLIVPGLPGCGGGGGGSSASCTAPSPPPSVTAKLIVSSAKGNDATASGACFAYKTITAALAHASSGDVVWVAPGTYDAANGEVFPVTVPAGVRLVGDEANKGNGGTKTEILGGGDIPADGGACAGNGWGTAVYPMDGAFVSGFVITNTNATSTYPVNIVVRNSNVTLQNNTIASSPSHGVYFCNNSSLNYVAGNRITGNSGVGLAFISGGTETEITGNTITSNHYGVEYDSDGGDLGGGPAGSTGGNIISCNTANDLWTNQGPSLTIYAADDLWDHSPPTQACSAGDDVCDSNGATIVTGLSTTASNPCP